MDRPATLDQKTALAGQVALVLLKWGRNFCDGNGGWTRISVDLNTDRGKLSNPVWRNEAEVKRGFVAVLQLHTPFAGST